MFPFKWNLMGILCIVFNMESNFNKFGLFPLDGGWGGGGFVTLATIRCERVSHSFSGEVLQWRGLWSGETWWCNQGLPGIELCVCLFTSTCPFLVLNFLNFAFWKIRWLAGLVRCIQSVFRGGEDENQQFIIVFSACHGLYSLNEM